MTDGFVDDEAAGAIQWPRIAYRGCVPFGFARKFPADYILEKIDVLDVLIESHDPNAPTSPAGWLRKAIEDDYAPPDWYKTKAEREALKIAQKRLQEQEAAEAEREREAERHKREQWRSMLIEQHKVSQKHLTLWAQTVSQVQEITVQENLKRWLGKTLMISQKDGTATIAVPYEYASYQMTNSALEECQEILGQAVGRPVDLRLEIIPYPHSE